MALQSDGSPNGFHILSVDGTGYTTTLVPAHDPARGQMRVVLDSQVHGLDKEVILGHHVGSLLAGPIATDALGPTRLVANLFDGGPRSKVEAVIGDRAPVSLTRVERMDPFVVQTYEQNRGTKKPWVEAVKSSHIWQMTLPADLPAGTHRVPGTAVGRYGRFRTTNLVLEVTA